jgi:hypothetical protein
MELTSVGSNTIFDFVPTEVGRLVYDYNYGTSEYIYDLKDHLGNVVNCEK